MHRVRVYYNCGWDDIKKINERFGFPQCTTINGETCKPVEVKDEDWPLLLETQRRGYIQIRKEYEEGAENKEE